MNTSKYKTVKLFEERRELEGRLFEVNRQLHELDENPFKQENQRSHGGLPIVGDIILLMIDTLERAIVWIVKQILR